MLDPAPEIVFYDGHCGLCHGAVKFILRRDHTMAFQFAPLQGPTIEKMIPPATRKYLPDSVVVLTGSGRTLTRSDAFLHILSRLGGGWHALALSAAIFPRPVRDAVYNTIARIRYRVFGRKDDLCPVMPAELRKRFLP
jgi:predicted DCC family thiol-disulfide oxidoreductase YuxK